MQNVSLECGIATDNARHSCNCPIHQVKCERQQDKTAIRNGNALLSFKFWREILTWF